MVHEKRVAAIHKKRDNVKQMAFYLPEHVCDMLYQVYADNIARKNKQSLSKMVGVAIERQYGSRADFIRRRD